MATRTHAGQGKTRAAARIMTIDTVALDKLAESYVPRSKPWTDDEVAVLKKYYGRVPIDKLAETLGRSMMSAQRKASMLAK